MTIKGMDVLNVFPAIKRLGEQRLQQLCDEFRAGYVAREFAISRLDVSSVGEKLSLDFTSQVTHQIRDGEEYYFPMDELLRFIADKGIADESERADTYQRIRNARDKGGPNVYRRFIMRPGPKLPIFITCKTESCKNLMQTDITAYKCEKVSMAYIEPITCRRCSQTYTYTDADFHFGPNQ